VPRASAGQPPPGQGIRVYGELRNELSHRRAASDAGHAAPDNTGELTFHRVRDLIVHGRLAPGSRIVEADLAAKRNLTANPFEKNAFKGGRAE
jgi:hypothetical protein